MSSAAACMKPLKEMAFSTLRDALSSNIPRLGSIRWSVAISCFHLTSVHKGFWNLHKVSIYFPAPFLCGWRENRWRKFSKAPEESLWQRECKLDVFSEWNISSTLSTRGMMWVKCEVWVIKAKEFMAVNLSSNLKRIEMENRAKSGGKFRRTNPLWY